MNFLYSMSKTKSIKIFRTLHKWPGVIIALFAILFAFSGIIMNHRQIFSKIDVSRNLLPSNYRYSNWNLAAVRGSLPYVEDTFLIYGNIGIWKVSDNNTNFTDFNQGFPKGIDNRKIYSVANKKEFFYAGTHFGLYQRRGAEEKWIKINLPVKQERIADVSIKGDTLLVLTRHHLLKTADGVNFNTHTLQEPAEYERKASMFTTLWQLHSGELFGLTGKLIVDLLGVVTVVLSVTGLLHFIFPKIIRRLKRRKKQATPWVKATKKNLRWHNILGYVFILFLIINTLAGIHLRPPLLIPIANKRTGIIPGTHLDNPNPWFDKLRRVEWNDELNIYVFSTSEGFYFADESLQEQLKPLYPQPPVSVMGLNVLKPVGATTYLTGSFNGMYLWDLKSGATIDFFTRMPYRATTGMARPVGTHMVAGLTEAKGSSWWFDYSKGALSLSGKPFPEMPEEIRSKSPMSLWNVALEIHTGRIFEHLIGPFYILYVPLAGLCLIMVLVSGFFIWWKAYRKKKGAAIQ